MPVLAMWARFGRTALSGCVGGTCSALGADSCCIGTLGIFSSCAFVVYGSRSKTFGLYLCLAGVSILWQFPSPPWLLGYDVCRGGQALDENRRMLESWLVRVRIRSH